MNRTIAAAVLVVIVIAAGGFLAFSYLTPGSSGQGGANSWPTTFASSSQPSSQASASGTGSGSATGTLNIYLADAPPKNATLKYLLLNVTGLELRYEGNVSGASSSSSTTSAHSSNNTSSASSSTTAGGVAGSTPHNVFLFEVPAARGTNLNLTRLQGQSLLLGATKVPAGNVTAMVLHISGARAFSTDGTSAQLKVVADGKLMIPFHFEVQANGSADLTIDIQPNDIHVSQGSAGVLTPVVHVIAVERGQSGTRTDSSSTDFGTTTTAVSNSTSAA